MKIMKTTSLKFFKPALATTLAIGSWRLVLLLATAVSLIGYPNPASAVTFNVTVGGALWVWVRAFVGNDLVGTNAAGTRYGTDTTLTAQ
jgi:hypothetical protein